MTKLEHPKHQGQGQPVASNLKNETFFLLFPPLVDFHVLFPNSPCGTNLQDPNLKRSCFMPF